MEAKKVRVNFYRERDEYGEFSNFYASPFTLNGKEYATVEHYFQAIKHVGKVGSYSIGTPLEEQVRLAPSPKIAKDLARSQKYALPNWEEIKDNVMYEGCKAKFLAHPKLKALLLSTGSALLVEHTKNDNYWGDGGDDTGRNQLGKTLIPSSVLLVAVSFTLLACCTLELNARSMTSRVFLLRNSRPVLFPLNTRQSKIVSTCIIACFMRARDS